MSNGHLTRAELKELLAGGAASEATRKLLAHHLELCRDCREIADRLQSSLSSGAERSLDQVYASAVEEATRELRRRSVLEARAHRDLRHLVSLPRAARRPSVERAKARFSSPVLADLLLEQCQQQVAADPWEALSLAECAGEVARPASPADFPQSFLTTLEARIFAHHGNALRATGDMKQAAELLGRAQATFESGGNGDPLVEAELLMLLASLRIDQKRMVEAEELLDRCLEIYGRLHETERRARVLVKKSSLLFEAHDLERALAAGALALTAIDAAANPKLYLQAHHNFVATLQELGRYQEAWERMRANDSLYEAYPDPWTQLRRRWLDGLIHHGLGDRATAHQCLTTVRAGFASRGLGFQSALVGLDLAYLLVEEGRTGEVKALAEEMVPVFMAQDLERDAAAAILLFQRAARLEVLTTSHLKQLIRYLTRLEPGAREAAS